jgi:hypothetical protein
MADPFQPKFVDLVCNYTSTTGTGNFTLGPTVNGFSSFTSALQPGDSFYYSALGIDKPAEREVGRGTLQANGSIARDPVSGTKTSFTGGTKILQLIAAAEWYNSVQAGASGVADGDKGDITVSGNGGSWALNPAGIAKIHVTPQQFGAKGDGVTDDSAAFVAAVAYLNSNALVPYAGWIAKGSPRLFIPSGIYNLGTTTLDLTHTMIIEGESTLTGYTSRLKWTGDCEGIRVQSYNTSGTATVDGVQHFTAAGTTLRNIALLGPYEDTTDFTGHTEGEYHAIRVKAPIIIEDVYIDGWAGDGLHALTSSGGAGAEEGNSNVSFVNRLRVTNVRNGVFLDGSDANAWTLIGIYGTYCRQHTVWDSSFLGNTHIGHHSANAGLVPGVPPSVVSNGTNRYYVKQGQAAGASTNAPPSGATSNTWWAYLSAGAAASWLNIPAWTSAVSVREGGGYRTDSLNGYNTFIGCYQEGGEGQSQFVSPTVVIGGIMTPDTTGNYLRGDRLIAPNGVALGQSRIASTSTSRTLGVHNSQALSGGVNASINFEQGFEADGVTPASLGAITARSTTNSPATAEGLIDFYTRTYGGTGGMTARITLDGSNSTWRPLTDNNMDQGLASFRWRAGYFYTINAATAVSSAGPITSTGGGVGYATGAGGTVNQATSKSTGVTLNKSCGQVTMNNAALAAATSVKFTLTNSTIAASDTVSVNIASGATDPAAYTIGVCAVAAGSCTIVLRNNSAASLSEALVLNFAVVKAVNA